MYHSAEAFIALPGGLGTLEEIACMASWSSLAPKRKPIGLLNINGYFNGLLSYLENAVEKGFMFTDTGNTIVSATTVEALLTKLQQFNPYPSTVVPHASGLGKRKRDVDDKGVDCTLSL